MSLPPILYDYQIFEAQRFGGISRYFCEIIQNLHIKHDVSILFSQNKHLEEYGIAKYQIPLPQFIFDRYQKKLYRKNHWYTKKKLQSASPYLLHPTYFDPYFLPYIGSNPYVITVHDMIYEKYSDLFPSAAFVINQKKEVITQAKRIIAISEHTKKDIVEILHIDPAIIDVIHHGVSLLNHANNKLKLPARYILFVGERSGYKNFERLLFAFHQLCKDDKELQLVCTGKPFTLLEQRQFKELGIQNRIIQMYASDSMLSQLYAQAAAFVYPSLYEGFGIPLLEAYANNCPVALSNASCFPEIAGTAGEYFDPHSIESIANAIKKIVYDREYREKLCQLGKRQLERYSWQKTALQTEETYKRAML